MTNYGKVNRKGNVVYNNSIKYCYIYDYCRKVIEHEHTVAKETLITSEALILISNMGIMMMGRGVAVKAPNAAKW